MVSPNALRGIKTGTLNVASAGKLILYTEDAQLLPPTFYRMFGGSHKINLTALERRGGHRVRINFDGFSVSRIGDLALWLGKTGSGLVGAKKDWLWFERRSDAMLFYLTFCGVPNGYAIKRSNNDRLSAPNDLLKRLKGVTKIEVGEDIMVVNPQRSGMVRGKIKEREIADLWNKLGAKIEYPSSQFFTFTTKKVKPNEDQV